jgi:hypothetical protein
MALPVLRVPGDHPEYQGNRDHKDPRDDQDIQDPLDLQGPLVSNRYPRVYLMINLKPIRGLVLVRVM